MPRKGQRGVNPLQRTQLMRLMPFTPLCRFRDISPSRGEIGGRKIGQHLILAITPH